MKYEHIITGTFLSRPNRFIAHVKIEERHVVCHVKNTGRCRELLIPGVTVVLEYHPDAALTGRKTQYDIIAVYKDRLLINMDSQAPNKAAWEWLKTSPQALLGAYDKIESIRREVNYEDSRFDLAFTLFRNKGRNASPSSGSIASLSRTPDNHPGTQAFMEVKGVSLEDEGMTMFPDAPTERGLKHLNSLIKAHQEGCEAYVLFVIQMKGIHGFKPNDATHPAFGQTLRAAARAGVHVLAWDCSVTPSSLSFHKPVPVLLD